MFGIDNDKELVVIEALDGLINSIGICDGVSNAKAKALLMMITPAVQGTGHCTFRRLRTVHPEHTWSVNTSRISRTA